MATIVDVRTVEDAKALLSRLELQEARVDSELDQLLEQQTHMDVRMASFRQMMPTLHHLHQDSGELCEAITRAAALAESVSSKVRVLDQAKSRVYAAMKRVDDVIDLKSCADGFQYAMNSGDYEKAAAHIHRYLTLDESMLLDGGIADSAKEGSATTVGGSFDVLRENEGRLKDMVRRRFREAAASDTQAEVERFGRLFPLLNLHEEGLDLYANYLRSKMRSLADEGLDKTAQASGQRVGVVYADTLTFLYEGTARLIEQHTPLVETCYGPDWMPSLVQKLQVECDGLVAKIKQQLEDERMLEHKVQTVRVALKAKTPAGAIRPDILELDTLLTELSLCSSRTELYFRFIQKKATVEDSSAGKRGAIELVRGSKTNLLIQELIGKYILLENYFMLESLRKAVEIDSCSEDGLTSSMADDIFFVLQKCTRRAFASCNVDGACAMLNHASSLLMEEYLELLRGRLKASLPSTGLDFSGIIQSQLQSSRSGASDNEASKPSTSIALNDMEVSIENLTKLTNELQDECSKLVDLLGESAKLKLDSCLTDFSGVGSTFKDLRQTAVRKVVEVLVLPRLLSSLELYSSLNHTLTETEFSNYEVNDPFVQPLIATMETALADIKVKFIPGVYKLLLGKVIDCVMEKLTAQVWKCSFNQLGGVQLDKDLRCLMGYLSTVCEWPVRDKFALLLQLATILSLDNVGEMIEYWGDRAGPLVWRLTPTEVKKALRLRADFDHDEIALLKLMDITVS
ncbi:conserved oligomeric Golgi complex subunit 4-like isoform X2 [Halichondria panicea]|uniref:conserved oligomeric Golgi complex subunit 4-like isoform X2 n=1 Tax=Halichondria panicea TaxID=6063 RepID=UPI00312BBCA0